MGTVQIVLPTDSHSVGDVLPIEVVVSAGEPGLGADCVGLVCEPGDADLSIEPMLRRFDEEHGDGAWTAVFGLDVKVSNSSGNPIALLRMPDVRRAAVTADPAGVADAMALAVEEGLAATLVALLDVRR